MRPEPTLPPGFVSSCQPVRGGWFDNAAIVARYARVSEAAGARALRIESLRDLRAVRPVTRLPITGLIKREIPGSDVFITPTPDDVLALAEAGADVIAFDATDRPRPHTIDALLAATQAADKEAMADVATFEEGITAWNAGCTYVGTTLSGYVAGSPELEGPDLELVRRLSQAGVRTIAEGRIATPDEAREAIRLGAYAVTIGTAISRPERLAEAFAAAIENAIENA